MLVAKWKDGFESMFKGVDAQTVAEEIRSIGETASTKDIVNKARDAGTELHKCFEWDDSVAAEKYREKQAGYVIHFLVIREEVVPKDRPEVHYFHRVADGEKTGYRETVHIVKQEDSYQALLAQAYRELRAFKAKYGCLQELSEILALID